MHKARSRSILMHLIKYIFTEVRVLVRPFMLAL